MVWSNFREVGVVVYLSILGLLSLRHQGASPMNVLYQFALALPVGYSYIVLSSLLSLLIFGKFIAIFVLLLPLPILLWIAKNETSEHLIRRVAEGLVVTVMYVSSAVFFRWANPVILSYDSFNFAFMGMGFAQGVPLAEFVDRFASFPLSVVPFHALAQYVGQDYSSTCSPIFMTCGVVGVIYFLHQYFWKGSLLAQLGSFLLVSTIACMVLSTYSVVQQSFYVNGHTAHGCVLFLATMLLGSLNEPSAASDRVVNNKIFLIFTFCTALLLGRLEGLLVTSLLLVLLSEGRKVTGKHFALGVLVLIVIHGAWAYLMLKKSDVWDAIISPEKVFGMIAAPVMICAAYCIPVIRRYSHLWRYLVILALVGGICFYAHTAPSEYAMSLVNLATNALTSSLWGILWPITILALVVAFTRERSSTDRAACFVVITYVLLILVLGYFREPYRVGWGDSANRMLGQILPLVIYILGRGILPATKPQQQQTFRGH